MNTICKTALPYDSGSRNKLFAITHTGLPGQQANYEGQAMKNMWQIHNDPAALPLHDQTLQQVVLAGVREIKPLYIPKITEPYKYSGNDTSTCHLQLPASIQSHKTVPPSKKSFKSFVAHRNYFTVFSQSWNLNKPQDSRFMCIFMHHCAFHWNWD